MLAEGYQHTGYAARKLTVSTMRQLLLNMDKGLQQTLLADEFNRLRNDPLRLERLLRYEDETDESFAFRTAKRQVALELWPPTTEGDPRIGEDASRFFARENRRSTSSGGGQEHLEPRRRTTNRLVLSGNPNEGNDSEGTPNN